MTPGIDTIPEILTNPQVYPDAPRSVELRETHISWVFLTDRYAYKLKKPVKFDFLDFSTPALRRAACCEEVRLNRRFAPHVYLNVVPLTYDAADDSWRVDGATAPVDWMVRMLRLPADRALDRMILEGRMVDQLGEVLSDHLAEFYRNQPPLVLEPEMYLNRLTHHITDNDREMRDPVHNIDSRQWRQIHGALRYTLVVRRELLTNRVLNGRIIEGHGDLRPEHIYLMSTPCVIDCIEFNQELRTVDALDDLCFLTMELDRLHAPQLARTMVKAYRRLTADDFDPRVALFYRCYRACVRAKVSLLRLQQEEDHPDDALRGQVEDYLQLASHDARSMLDPVLLIVGGSMGTGKTTLARGLAEELCWPSYSSDDVRRELFGASHGEPDYGEGIYRPDVRNRVYTELLARAEAHLREGESVILDATFGAAEHRDRAESLARKEGARFVQVRCTCPEATARQRIAERQRYGGSTSEARPELVGPQRDESGTGDGKSSAEILTIDTSDASIAPLPCVFRCLAERLG